MIALRALERFARAEPSPRAPRCELCAGPIDAAHAHVADLERRAIHCACRACATLFRSPGGGRHRTIPTRVLFDPALSLTDAQWAALGVPVRLAFFLHTSALDRWVAVYPSPAGATEAEIDAPAWADLARGNRLVARIEPDVEALLVRGAQHFARPVLGQGGVGAEHSASSVSRANPALTEPGTRDRGRAFEALLAPIDACYEMVAIVRTLWKGFDGGDAVRAALDRFFADLRARGRPLEGA